MNVVSKRWVYCALIAVCACGGGGTGSTDSSGSGGTAPIATGSGGVTSPGSGGSTAHVGGSGGMHGTLGSGGATSMPGTGGMSAGSGGMQTMIDAGMLPGSDAGGMGTGGSGSTAQTLPSITDYTKDGPFTTTMESNTGPNSNYTIFRPEPMGANGFLHSPIIFGPGIVTTPPLYATLLNHLASHGFVTICVNSLNGGPGDPTNLSDMKMGLEWLIAQNSESGSVFEGKLAVDRAVTMGYSVGATASTQLSSHAAIMTTVSIHGHNTMGDPHGPILLLTGTSDVIDDNRTTLTTLDEAPAILAALPIGHLDVPTEISTGGRYIAPITAWLRYWVNGDQDAKSFFLGADCKMCSSPWITPETNAKWKALTP